MGIHYACPFGAVSSVYAWEEIGDLITRIARKYLHLAIFRYVDDFFGPERRACCIHAWLRRSMLWNVCRKECLEHAVIQ